MKRRVDNQSGIALVGVLILTTIMLWMAVIGAKEARFALNISSADLRSHKAMAYAEAGLDHALQVFESDTNGPGDELADSGIGGILATLGSATTVAGVGYRFVPFGGGNPADGYYIRLEDNYDETAGANDPDVDVDRTVELVSRGYAGGAERIVRTAFRQQLGPRCAIVSDQDLLDSGNPILTGAQGCIHANEDLYISGNPILGEGATSTGTLSIAGTPTMEGELLDTAAEKTDYSADNSGADLIDVPSVRPLSFGTGGINLADEVNSLGGFLLGSDCRVYDSSAAWFCTESPANCTGGAMVADLSAGGTWNGWDCSADATSQPAARWNVAGAVALNGAFLVEGWVNISGNPVNWQVTLVAFNSIDVSGTPSMEPFAAAGNLRNLLMVSGNDIGLGGNMGSDASPGAIFAHQQMKNNGNPVLKGFIVAECGGSTWAGDVGANEFAGKDIISGGDCYDISGDMTIHYDGLDTSVFAGEIEPLRRTQARAY